MDYEHQPANHINFRLADKILVPFTFNLSEVKKFGATSRKLIKYPGLKEEIYLWQFRQQQNFWEAEFPELDPAKVICTIRPPATMAAYHNFENPIFFNLLTYLLEQPNVQPVVFSRTQEQRRELQKTFPELYLAEKSVDGAQLIANSDIIISGGGTMNREAAVLGTPAYTIFAGKMGSVDKYLVEKGKVALINSREDFEKIILKKKIQKGHQADRRNFDFIVFQITGQSSLAA